MNISDFGLSDDYKQLSIRYDESHEALWTYFNQPNRVPCANHDLVKELNQHQTELENSGGMLYANDRAHNIKYSVAASLTPNVFNLGGQLSLIRELAKDRNKEALLYYAVKSIDGLASRLNRYNTTSIVNITLLQGLALGGGLEAALASDVIIAERKSIVGFPEILFNMFPGMGGYSLVSRKAGVKVADEMILKGKQYTAEQAFELGIIDVLVEDGQGEKAVYDWINHNKRFFNGYLAAQRAKNRIHPITYDELLDITKIWVDVALKLGDREFSIMDRFIYSQEKQYLKAATAQSSQSMDNVVSIKRTAA